MEDVLAGWFTLPARCLSQDTFGRGQRRFDGFLNGQGNFMTLDALADAMNLTGRRSRETDGRLGTELIKRVRQAAVG